MKGKIITLAGTSYLFLNTFASNVMAQRDEIRIDDGTLGFRVPDFGELLTWIIKFFFVLAGILALFYMLWGAINWVTSGGDKEAVGAAQKKIVAAVVGILLIVATLTLIVTLEQVVFKQKICFGISCNVTIPTLLKEPGTTPKPAPTNIPQP